MERRCSIISVSLKENQDCLQYPNISEPPTVRSAVEILIGPGDFGHPERSGLLKPRRPLYLAGGKGHVDLETAGRNS